MKKIAIIYWSNGGNVEVLADSIAKGAEKQGAQIIIKHVQDAKLEDITTADAVAFGSPSMDNNNIEQKEMEPFINQFKLLPNNNKPTVLFGSYGWDEGKFIEQWKVKMNDFGFSIIGTLAVKEAPTKEELENAEELGAILAK